MLGCGLLDLKEEEGGRGRGIYPTWASGVYLTGGGVYLTKVVSCYPFLKNSYMSPNAKMLAPAT